MKRILLLFGVVMLLPILSFAGAKTAAHMEMNYISSGKYEVLAYLYRDCRGTALSGIAFSVSGNGVSSIITTTRTSITEVNFGGPGATAKCSPSNTYGTGKGLERHTYKAIIDFNQSPFNTSDWTNSCEITVAFGQCCRNNAITTGQAGGNFYMDLVFDKCLAANNSTPRITSGPLFELANTQPVYYDYGIKEDDGDSISVKFSAPRSSFTFNLSYGTSNLCSKPFTATMPLTPYIHNPCGPLTANANHAPPIGFYLGENTGELIFTPTESLEVGIICITITEWRKIGGVYKNISTISHEMTVHNETNAYNNIPIIQTSVNQTVIAGERNCFAITFKDDPVGTLPGDTLDVSWSDTIAGATFNVDTTKRLRPATFCWIPSCSDIGQPYRFKVHVKDRVTPIEGRTTRTFNLTVIEKPKVSLGPDKHVCENTEVTLEADSNYQEYLWSNNDTNYSIKTSTEGTYWVKATSACNKVSYDSINVIHHAIPDVKLPNDTLICDDTIYQIGINAPNALTYEWNTLATTDSIIVDKPGYYMVAVNDKYCGTLRDTMLVTFLKSPVFDLGADRHYCKVVNKTIAVNSVPQATYLWSTGEKTQSIFVTKPDKYWVKVTNACGTTSDTIDYSDQTPKLNLNLGDDVLVCDKDSFTLTSNINGDEYVWSTFDNTKSITVTEPGEYILRVDRCQQRAFDTILVDFNKTPIPNLGADQQLDTPFSINLDAGVTADSYLWSTNESTKTISITGGGTYWVDATNECGTARDSITILVNGIVNNTPIAESIKVYPNPLTESELTINFTEAQAQNISISVIALTGKEVYKEKVRVSGNQNHTIDLGDLPAGIYFLQLKSVKGSATIKLVVN